MLATGTDSDLYHEIEADARAGYAALLTALGRVAHQAPEAGSELTAAVHRLREWWAEARILLADPDDARSMYPLTPSATRWVDTLLTLAVYSGASAVEVEAAGRMIHRLSTAVRRPAIPAAA